MRLEELADQELRLLALAVGDHGLPVEVRERIASLRERARDLADAVGRRQSMTGSDAGTPKRGLWPALPRAAGADADVLRCPARSCPTR